MKRIIPYSKQEITEDDIKAVVKVLRSDWITQGPSVTGFEQNLCKTTGARYAVAVSNATAALHISCLALNLAKGDEVLTSPISFLSSSNCVFFAGARPVFVDITPDTHNIDPALLAAKTTKKTKAIIPVHFGGHPCDMEKIGAHARKHKLAVIEDASHALGARYKANGRVYRVGACAHSDACVFSFHPVKGVTTGEGGAVTTNNRKLYELLLKLRCHGMTRNPNEFQNKKLAFRTEKKRTANGWYYEMQELGFNYRITDIQCALGVSQLKRLPQFLKRKEEIVEKYARAFSNQDALTLPTRVAGYRHAYHLYAVCLNDEKLTVKREVIFHELREKGIGVQIHYIPIYLQPYYKKNGYAKTHCPESEAYYSTCLSLPMYPSMKDNDVSDVIRIVNQMLNKYRKKQ